MSMKNMSNFLIWRDIWCKEEWLKSIHGEERKRKNEINRKSYVSWVWLTKMATKNATKTVIKPIPVSAKIYKSWFCTRLKVV